MMDLIEMKILRMYLELKVVAELYAVRDLEAKGWKMHVKLRDGREFGVRTAIKNEKVYAKLDTIIDQIDEITCRPILTTRLL